MTWDIKEIEYYLQAFRYNDAASVWPAKISEAAHDVNIDDKQGCSDVEGFAVDLNGDTRPELFLFGDDKDQKISMYSDNMPGYVEPLLHDASVSEDVSHFFSTCSMTPADIRSYPFPFKGALLPDTKGKITGLIFEPNQFTLSPIAQMMEFRPDLDFYAMNPVYPDMCSNENEQSDDLLKLSLIRGMQTLLIPNSGKLVEIPYEPDGYDGVVLDDAIILSPRNFNPLWMQDRLLVGTDETNNPVVYSHKSMMVFAFPLSSSGAANVFDTDSKIDGGDLLSSSKYIFYNNRGRSHLGPHFREVLGGGRELIGIGPIPNDIAHLDMVFTPTEDIKDGKPVVLVAEAEYAGDFEDEKPANADEIETRLDAMAEALSDRFYVERMPLVYVAEQTDEGYCGEPVKRLIAVSYNNILMENYFENGVQVKNVYMPWYGDKPLQEFNEDAAEKYNDYGYKVHAFNDLEAPATLGGSIRCMTKVLKRGE